jgi:tripartite-type tricarboxylate transporter receptor subunit TctC
MARAQAWPTRPVRLIVPFVPGGPADLIGRILAEPLASRWGQPVIVENRGGAGGNLGAELVARAAPDGHTLLLNTSGQVQGAAMYRKLAFDPVADFTPIAMVAYYGLVVVVRPDLPVSSLADFVALMRARPGEITVASAGVGTPTQLTSELFRLRTGTVFTPVPFNGAAPAQTALLAGQVDAMFQNPVLAVPAVRDGKLRALATTGAARAEALPDVPTVAEQGYPGFDGGTWYAFLGPMGLPAALTAKIEADLCAIVAQPAVRERFAAQSLETRNVGAAELGGTMREDLRRWSALIRRLGITQE